MYRVGLLSLWDRLFLKYVYGGGLLSLWVELVGWAVLKTGRTMVLAGRHSQPEAKNPLNNVAEKPRPTSLLTFPAWNTRN